MKSFKQRYNATLQVFDGNKRLYYIALINVEGQYINRASDFGSPFKGDGYHYTKEWYKHMDKILKRCKDSDFEIVIDDGKSYFNYLKGDFSGLVNGFDTPKNSALEQLKNKFTVK